jgi:hypothetical protein
MQTEVRQDSYGAAVIDLGQTGATVRYAGDYLIALACEHTTRPRPVTRRCRAHRPARHEVTPARMRPAPKRLPSNASTVSDRLGGGPYPVGPHPSGDSSHTSDNASHMSDNEGAER